MTLPRLRIVVLVTVVQCAGSYALAQEPASKVKTPGKGDAVVVKGCLSGPTLQAVETTLVDQGGSVSMPLTYQLKGDKGLVKRMREQHDGKVVEVTGVLKSNLPGDGGGGGRTVGKTKITFGIGSPSGQKGAPLSQPALPVLEVKSYDGSGARCGG